MLALTRRKGEVVVIGDPAKPLGTIRVVDIQGEKVRLAFDFDAGTQVNRKEIADLKAQGKPPAAAAAPEAATAAAPVPASVGTSKQGSVGG